jgi:sugar phosphate permease
VSGSARRLGLAGFLAIAVAFGPARNGFGLFLPDLRREFGLSTEIAGLVAGWSYAGYLVSLSLVGLFAARFGPRLFVTIGGLSAALGMALVALASNAPFLAAGLVLAATHAGWSWSPYNDAVDREVSPRLRGRVLSAVSTGTTFGIVGVSAVLYGAGVMCMSALLSVWSSLLFPEQPSTGFSAALFLYGIGTIAGPVALGAFAGHSGLGAAFLVAGALALSTTPVAAFARTPEASSAKAANAPPEEPAPERGR